MLVLDVRKKGLSKEKGFEVVIEDVRKMTTEYSVPINELINYRYMAILDHWRGYSPKTYDGHWVLDNREHFDSNGEPFRSLKRTVSAVHAMLRKKQQNTSYLDVQIPGKIVLESGMYGDEEQVRKLIIEDYTTKLLSSGKKCNVSKVVNESRDYRQ
ncbi:hypothetical protein QOT17_011062 [Balamuthia mandrillaris]